MNHAMIRPSKGAMKGIRSFPRSLLAVSIALLLGVAAPAAALKDGEMAPEIVQNDLDGKPFKLSALRGKVVLVDFWASWCKPCRAELPALDELHRTYRARGFEVVGVSLDRDPASARSFLRDRPVGFRNVHDQGAKIADGYRPTAMPSSYLIDRSGRVRYVHAGFRAGDEAVFKREIESLLK